METVGLSVQLGMLIAFVFHNDASTQDSIECRMWDNVLYFVQISVETGEPAHRAARSSQMV